MLRQERVHQLWDHGLVVADDAGKECLAGAQLADEILAHLLMDAATRDVATFDGAPQAADRGGLGIRHIAILLAARGESPALQLARRTHTSFRHGLPWWPGTQ